MLKIELLSAAIVGWRTIIESLETKIAEAEAELKGDAKPSKDLHPRQESKGPQVVKSRGGRRSMSAAGRKAIAAAQRKRWSEYHKKQAGAA